VVWTNQVLRARAFDQSSLFGRRFRPVKFIWPPLSTNQVYLAAAFDQSSLFGRRFRPIRYFWLSLSGAAVFQDENLANQMFSSWKFSFEGFFHTYMYLIYVVVSW
jgi:hypothetical protein